jgi:hypothetical protein
MAGERDPAYSSAGRTLRFQIEAAIYQINRLPERRLERFMQPVGVTCTPTETMDQPLRRALAGLCAQYRTITPDKYERLVIQAAASSSLFHRSHLPSPATKD